MTNGSWSGRDPWTRRLRAVAAVTLLVLLAYVILDGQPDNLGTVGTIVGALLVDLGFEVGVRWPGSKA